MPFFRDISKSVTLKLQQQHRKKKFTMLLGNRLFHHRRTGLAASLYNVSHMVPANAARKKENASIRIVERVKENNSVASAASAADELNDSSMSNIKISQLKYCILLTLQGKESEDHQVWSAYEELRSSQVAFDEVSPELFASLLMAIWKLSLQPARKIEYFHCIYSDIRKIHEARQTLPLEGYTQWDELLFLSSISTFAYKDNWNESRDRVNDEIRVLTEKGIVLSLSFHKSLEDTLSLIEESQPTAETRAKNLREMIYLGQSCDSDIEVLWAYYYDQRTDPKFLNYLQPPTLMYLFESVWSISSFSNLQVQACLQLLMLDAQTIFQFQTGSGRSLSVEAICRWRDVLLLAKVLGYAYQNGGTSLARKHLKQISIMREKRRITFDRSLKAKFNNILLTMERREPKLTYENRSTSPTVIRTLEQDTLQHLIFNVYNRGNRNDEREAWNYYNTVRLNKSFSFNPYTITVLLNVVWFFKTFSPIQKESCFDMLWEDVNCNYQAMQVCGEVIPQDWHDLFALAKVCSWAFKINGSTEAYDYILQEIRDRKERKQVESITPMLLKNLQQSLLSIKDHENGLPESVRWFQRVVETPSSNEMVWQPDVISTLVRKLARKNPPMLEPFVRWLKEHKMNDEQNSKRAQISKFCLTNNYPAAKIIFDDLFSDPDFVPHVKIFQDIIDGVLKDYINIFCVDPHRTMPQLGDEIEKQNTLKAANGYIAMMSKYKLKVTCEILESFMYFYTRVKDAKNLFEVYNSLGSNASLKAHTMIISYYFKNGMAKNVIKILEGFEDQNKESILDPTLTGVLMKGFLKCGLHSEAVKYYEMHLAQGYRPTRQNYRLLIQILTLSGEMGLASKVWDDYTSAGYTPDEVMYSLFIHGYGKDGNFAAAKDVYDSMKGANIPYTVIIYKALIMAALKCADLEMALELYRSLESTGLEGDAFTLSILVKIHARRCDEEEMLKALSQYKNRGYEINGRVLTPVISYYAMRGDFTTAFEYAERLGKEMMGSTYGRLQLQGCHQTILVGLSTRKPYQPLVFPYMKGLMECDGVSLTMCATFMRVLGAQKKFKQLRSFFLLYVCVKFKPNASSYFAFLNALWAANVPQEMARYCKKMADAGFSVPQKFTQYVRKEKKPALKRIHGRVKSKKLKRRPANTKKIMAKVEAKLSTPKGRRLGEARLIRRYELQGQRNARRKGGFAKIPLPKDRMEIRAGIESMVSLAKEFYALDKQTNSINVDWLPDLTTTETSLLPLPVSAKLMKEEDGDEKALRRGGFDPYFGLFDKIEEEQLEDEEEVLREIRETDLYDEINNLPIHGQATISGIPPSPTEIVGAEVLDPATLKEYPKLFL